MNNLIEKILLERHNFNNNFNKFVKLHGEVISEGVYSISNRTINQIINDAGGFTSNAFIDGVELYRDSLRVALNSLDRKNVKLVYWKNQSTSTFNAFNFI